MAADHDGPTVRDLLGNPLRMPRVQSLEEACARIADRPLEGTVAELRACVSEPVTGEGSRRLHVLISTLYHRSGAPLALTEELRAQIQTSKE